MHKVEVNLIIFVIQGRFIIRRIGEDGFIKKRGMNWNRFSLFKLPNRHKRFDYVPRYYDAEKESLLKKLKQAEKENLLDENGKYAREIKFKAKVENKWGNSDYKAQSMRSNVRLIVILGVVIVLFYYIFVGLDGIGYFLDENLDKLK